MSPSATVIADSLSPDGKRLTTMQVTFHRFVLAEFNTHRIFSRNSASSRAIPVTKMLQRVHDDPAWPITWPREQPGMQGGGDLEGQDLIDARYLFINVRDATLGFIDAYFDRHPDKSTRLHKSLVNRLLEPFMWHTVIVTATSFEGFFDQRVSPLAQPEIQAPAALMLEAYRASTPTKLKAGEWHRPYVDHQDEVWALDLAAEHDITVSDALNRMSVARCARVSTLNQDGERNPANDLLLYERLVSATPMHASPLEHVATPGSWSAPGNFQGWRQLRHAVELQRKAAAGEYHQAG